MNQILLLSFFLFSWIVPGYPEQTVYPFANDPIDVVIPSVEKDLLTLHHCIRGIRENGQNIRRIIVVSKKKLTDEAEWFDEGLYPFSFRDIARALAKDDPILTEQFTQTGSRTGWYFQQLLKLYAPLVIPGISSNVLILDSDVMFLNPVSFLNPQNGALYNPGWEHHTPYFVHANRLLPGFHQFFSERYSGISHHMVFQKPVIEALLAEVEQRHNAPFWDIFCRLVEPQEISQSGASEYEIYFNYVFEHSTQVSLRFLKWKNIERMSEVPKCKKQGFHYVCLHSYHRKED